ncbi:MAG: helix-turn-helix domain-containing protein [Parvibaculum sp.]|uniref:helix-turn-helix domain-containing protein n=1 Tax=Parvibaculum sp. TaxID=2024848 RepID=UPI0025E30CB6|nr:helix-turn-helix domain-containing protein [Parvibaculum sp.]MCE9650086.1 helix-turn-helix domain-containing protein [Parvibaculum sp.]
MSVNLAHSETISSLKVARRPWPVIVGEAAKTAPSGDDFAALETVGARMTFGRNETIFSEGDCAKYCYRLVSGSVRLCKLLADGRRQISDFFLPGDFFGYADFDTYALSAEAVTGVVVTRYARNQVEAVSESDSRFRRRLGQLLHERFNAAQLHLVMLGRYTVKERISSFLIQMAERLDPGAGSADEIELPMSRLDIADYLGLTIETVCRAISDLKRADVIAVPSIHRIVLRKPSVLRDLVEGGEHLLA